MNESVSTPPADAPVRLPSRSPENWWFWWGMAWGGAASVAGGATAYLHWKTLPSFSRSFAGFVVLTHPSQQERTDQVEMDSTPDAVFVSVTAND
jgi:hypothetical protein